jgi:hypothetical protein
LQVLDVLVDGVEMTERSQLLLKRPQAHQVSFIGAAGADLGIRRK